MKVKNESEVAQSCLTLSDPIDCSVPGSSIHGIFQARVLEWGAIAFSNNSLQAQYSIRYRGAMFCALELPSSVAEIRHACKKEPENHPICDKSVGMM